MPTSLLKILLLVPDSLRHALVKINNLEVPGGPLAPSRTVGSQSTRHSAILALSHSFSALGAHQSIPVGTQSKVDVKLDSPVHEDKRDKYFKTFILCITHFAPGCFTFHI